MREELDNAELPIKLDNSRARTLARELLYKMVWSEPMIQVAAQLGVSSSYMARVCTQLNIPRPARGYWAKLAAGRAMKQPALPEPRPGDPLEWPRDGSQPKRAQRLPKPPERRRRRLIIPPEMLPHVHPLVSGAKPHFEAARLSYYGAYLVPAKKLLVDLAITKSGLDKALSFASELFLALEMRGYRVVIAPNYEQFHRTTVDEREHPGKDRHYNDLWSPIRCTVAYIGTVAIGLTIIETSEEAEARYVNGEYVRLAENIPKRRSRYTQDLSWTCKHDFPTGRLCLSAYSPYPRAKWSQQWRETKDQNLLNRIRTIIRDLEKAANEVALLVEEGERLAELERQRWKTQQEQWRREETERRAVKAIKDSREDLLGIIDAWAAAKRLEEFFDNAERRAKNLPDEQRERLVRRLRRARELIENTDVIEAFDAWRAPEER